MIVDDLDRVLMLILALCLFILFALPKVVERFSREKKRKLMIRSGIRDIDRMTGFEFEEYLKVLFKKLGYKSALTRKTGDFGADLVLIGRNKIVVQAKRYGFKNKVGVDAVREVYASKAYYKADEAWVVTNSFFTEQAKELADACGVKLLNRNELQKFIVEVQPKDLKE